MKDIKAKIINNQGKVNVTMDHIKELFRLKKLASTLDFVHIPEPVGTKNTNLLFSPLGMC